jgi:hypothetical protein
MSEKKEEVVHLGKIEPLKRADFPILPGILATMGPGVIWASMAQGSGELIWWPYLILIIMLILHIYKYFL